MKYRTRKCFIMLFLFVLVSQGFTYSIVHAERNETKQVERLRNESNEKPELFMKIKKEAGKRRIPPINASVDRIWHAIPGYNGLEVDIEKTYQKTKKAKDSNEIQFIYHEISPEINLEDLDPQPIYRGNPKKQMASIMINVAWGDQFIPKILNILEKENVRATFFFDGSWLKKHIDTAKHIASLGHEMSNHAYSHKNMSQLSKSNATEEIKKTESLLTNELGVVNRLFAPPSGDYDSETVNIAHGLHLKTVLWTLDTVDWRHPSPQSIIQKISTQVEPGSMILMHPTDSSSMALEGMILQIKRKGLILGTVSELISTNRVPNTEPNR